MSATGVSSRNSCRPAKSSSSPRICSLECAGVVRRQRGERACDRGREVVTVSEPDNQCGGLLVLGEHEMRESRRIAPDRALRLRGSCVQRPPRVRERALSVARDEPRLDRPDGPPPAVGRCVSPALSIALGCTHEPTASLLVASGHEQREPGRPGRVPHARQLPLSLVFVFGQPRRSVVVALDRPRSSFVPVTHHSRSIVSADGSHPPMRWSTSTAFARHSVARARTATSGRRARTTWR